MNELGGGYSKNFVKKFTLSILRVIERDEFKVERPIFIDADLIPKISRGLMESLVERDRAIKSLNSQASLLHIEPAPHFNPAPGIMAPPQGPPMMRDFSEGEYGAITKLLADPSISKIVLSDSTQPLTVIRHGQREFTKITLTKEEIQEILQAVADKAHVPLLDGTFRAAVDNFSVNAVSSELVGHKFVIDKQGDFRSPMDQQTNKPHF